MRVILVVLTAVLVGCSAPPPAPLVTEDATAELKPFVEKLMADWSTLDVAKVAKYYAKEPGLPFYDVAPLKFNGWQEYEDGAKKTFAQWKSIKITINPDLKASKQGNIAWATFASSFEIVMKTGEVMKGEGRNTEVLEKRGTDWVIVHDHASAPMPDAPPPPAAKKK